METAFPKQLDSTSLYRVRLFPRAARFVMGLSMVVSDAVALLLAWILAVGVRAFLIGSPGFVDHLWMIGIIVLFLFVCAVRQLYPAIGIGLIEEFRQLTIVTMLIFIVSGTVAFLLREQISRLSFCLMWLFALAFIFPLRSFMRRFMFKVGLWGEPVVIFGSQEQALRVASYLITNPNIGLIPCGYFTSLEDFLRDCCTKRITAKYLDGFVTAVVTYEGLYDLAVIREQFRDVFKQVYMINATDSFDLAGVSLRELGTRPTFEIRYTLMDHWAQRLKRTIDLFVATFGIIVLAIPMAIIALAIYFESPGKIIYRQPRVGKGGRIFSMFKFRTMVENADQILKEYLDKNPEKRIEWERYQKLRDDPRITRIGRLLRRFSLDELPQLWNIIRGEMSLVGPRPITVDQLEIYGPNLKYYSRVTPGITGMWQISGRNKTTFSERVYHDTWYVMNWSIWLDAFIMFRTIWIVLKQEGAW